MLRRRRFLVLVGRVIISGSGLRPRKTISMGSFSFSFKVCAAKGCVNFALPGSDYCIYHSKGLINFSFIV